jgi:hypothetical protein
MHRTEVVFDQHLREKGEGDSALTNPHIQVRASNPLFVAAVRDAELGCCVRADAPKVQEDIRGLPVRSGVWAVRVAVGVAPPPPCATAFGPSFGAWTCWCGHVDRPQTMWWRLILLARKLCFAVIVVMVNKNIELQ